MPAGFYKFDEFELDGAQFELRREGRALRVERIPLELLILLVERNGDLVARQEIIERLWGKDVFLDTDQGINTAIRKIRTALRDDADKSRYIQTVSGKGYRFIAEVKDGNGNAGRLAVASETTLPASVEPAPPQAARVGRRHRAWSLAGITALVLFLIIGAALAFNVVGLRDQIFASHRIGPIHSIAVLPLANLSGDASQNYYADGMTDELITALARNRSLRVVSRTSVMQYKGVNRPLHDIAQSLGVDGILEGSVARSGGRVHVNLQLIYAPTDTHMWAESYDRDPTTAMSLPEELSQTIAAEAKVAAAAARPHRYISPEAHDAYLQGRYFWFANNFQRSIEFFQKAIQLQPDYALAWDGIGDAYLQSGEDNGIPSQQVCAKEDEATQKAMSLDDSLAEVHNSMAVLNLFCKWDFHNAEAESLRALELDPNYAEGRFMHSQVLIVMNREEDALQEAKRANDLSPYERPWGLGYLYIHMRRYDDAINELKLRAEVLPSDPGIHFLLSQAYWLKGMWKESEQELERAFQVSGDTKMAAAEHRAFAQGGEKAVEQLGVKTVLERAQKRFVPAWDIAFQYAFPGNKEQTLKYLEVAYRDRSSSLVFIQREAVLDFLHSDPRYRAIVTGMGLPRAY